MKNVTCAWLLLLLLAFGGCQKATPDPAEPEDAYPFVAGDLLVGIKVGVPIEQVFQLANAQQFVINQMNGFDYVSALPKDSLAYVQRVVRAKPYFNQRGFTPYTYLSAVDGSLREASTFFSMDLASQQDWLATVPQLRLTAGTGDYRNVQLKVPAGQEKFWRAELRKNPVVKWTELNTIGGVKLY
ncbi:hypothetical protein ACFQ48_10240 [Hymenobacter caeli]|uniref:Uncharacterized protein n=1 Tax=Hymenobacter caeli TaxID=2735894 RepID=A0ABX2FS51_9BACT|nr:hypothetical protein [Hymenobacter caeli]NRT19777.1 hypothetical protein [Hymenobacter caeli]